MKIIILISLLYSSILFADNNNTLLVKNNIWKTNNIWIRTHVNNKNYTTTINNIVKIEQKIKKAKDDVAILEKLHSKLVHQKSKLKLYAELSHLILDDMT